ncbi:MAG: HAMP domain-containing sensor histidine kinase, partial [Paracoccaceae bacterium]|nr:HAMP domain-containing sensor histidine kinase [Paracoccaceae bacterium]
MRIRNKLLIAISVPVGLLVLQIALVNFFVRELQEAVTFIAQTQDTIEVAFASDDLITELREEAKRLPSSFVSDRAAGDEGLAAFHDKFASLRLRLSSILASETARSAAAPRVASLDEAFSAAQSELDRTNAALTRTTDMDTLLERAIFLDASLLDLSSALGDLTRDLRTELQIAVDRERAIHNRPVIAGLAMGGLSILMLLGFTWLVVDQQFVSRLTELSQSMLSLAAGNLDIALEPPKGRDEVDEMARTIETFRKTARERDQLLKEQERAAERLEAQVAERTAELETANTFKSRFLASASHDLRQPLQALNLFIGQLRETSDADERQRLEERISDAATTMNELFDALLDMSKLEAGILVPEVTSFPISDLFDRLDATFATAARKRGLSLRLLPADVWVQSDAILLERILLNLISNAISATDQGGVLVGCRRRGENIRIDV